jgi:fatty acid desaturase
MFCCFCRMPLNWLVIHFPFISCNNFRFCVVLFLLFFSLMMCLLSNIMLGFWSVPVPFCFLFAGCG